MTTELIFQYLTLATITALLCLILINSRLFGSVFSKVFYVPAHKSDTGAQLLGGLPVVVSSLFLVIGFSGQFELNDTFSWLVPAFILSAVGFVDDHFEIKAKFKVLGQFFAALTFSYFSTVGLENTMIVFPIVFGWSLCVFNGSNLLDGIDGYSVKYSLISLATFTILGFAFGNTLLATMSILFTAPIAVFYFFNRYPSKLHLGEIGGTILGLNTLFLMMIFYKVSLTAPGRTVASLEVTGSFLLLGLSIMHLPMTELGLSCLRRIYNKKSPFKGDKLHVHYILTNLKGYGSERTGSILAGLHAVGLVINLSVSFSTNFTMGFFASGIFYVGYYCYIGRNHWNERAVEDKQVLNIAKEKEVFRVLESTNVPTNVIAISAAKKRPEKRKERRKEIELVA